jgi:hypothetical protein
MVELGGMEAFHCSFHEPRGLQAFYINSAKPRKSVVQCSSSLPISLNIEWAWSSCMKSAYSLEIGIFDSTELGEVFN